MKICGNEPTALELSALAEKAYSESDNITIAEHEDGTYSIAGIEERSNMTAEEVNSWLEDLARDCGIEITYTVKPEFWDLWFLEETEDHTVTSAEISRLAGEWGKTEEELMSQLEQN